MARPVMRLRSWKFHRKVWFWWNDWMAVQVVWMPEFSLGVRVEPRRPLVDVFLGVATIAIGRHPLLTDPRFKHRHADRGFLHDPVRLEDAPL